MAQPKNLVIPMKLDAFVFNTAVCDGGPTDAKIAPITQPNYTFLQLDDSLIQNDILDHADLHNSSSHKFNSRITDLGQQPDGKTRTNRIGVYVHWTLPRFYRSGVAATPSVKDHDSQRQAKGLGAAGDLPAGDYSAPSFRPLPNRWLVIRTLDPNAVTTVPNASDGVQINSVEAWVIESDRMRKIDDVSLDNADLQVDVSPYITSQSKTGDPGNISIADQAEIFIGYRQLAQNWSEDPTQERVDLTVLSSSNHLFPDYQPHCSNVFSMLDTFDCTINGEPGTLTAADASYYVIGWHSAENDGPFGNMTLGTRDARMKSLNMILNGTMPHPDDIAAWLKSDKSANVLCHGAMYQVSWNSEKLPLNVPANDKSKLLNEDMQIAIGTTPIDSLLTFIDAHQLTDLEKDLKLLGPLLRAQDDGVEAQRAANDEVQNWNFARSSGGQHWYFQSEAGKPAVDPDKSQADNLEILNQAQRMLDSTLRVTLQLQWNMFSYWWQYASSITKGKPPLDDLSKQITDLQALAAAQQDTVNSYSTNSSMFTQLPKAGVLPEYWEPRDPTLLIGGIEAGWPDDYLNSLKVRLDTQLIPLTSLINTDMSPFHTDKLPLDLQGTALALAQEFLTLAGPGSGPVPPPGHYFPLYHDYGLHGADSDPLRDQWGNTQAWFPLFVEWEAEYFHIPYADWALNGKRTDISDSRWRLGINSGVNLLDPLINDTRTVSGRIMLLPQPNFSLQAQIQQLFNKVNQDALQAILPDPAQREKVLNDTYQLPFLSAPLDGFRDHLLTLVQGTHIKPNTRYPADGKYPLHGIQPLPDAVIGPFTLENLSLIDKNSDITPYGSLVRFIDPTAGNNSQGTYSPFKPVTHGQFRFIKLNVIDKFGQAIHAIDPRYGHESDHPVYPCISDYYAPQLYNQQPNLVRPAAKPGYCEFVQIPPQINQPARLNSAFVIHDTRFDKPTTGSEYSYWRPVTEWENPIWGWLVLNYVDYGLQVFLPDGTFYREVRIVSPTAPKVVSTSAKWLPFDPPADPPSTGQLDKFLEKLANSDQTYLLAFLKMVNNSLQSSSSVPSAYASFLNSLVGRPLALVNAGYSLELSSVPKRNQSTLDGRNQTAAISKATTQNIDTQQPASNLGAQIPLNLLDDPVYEFFVKLGDQNRASDGLLGYFNTYQNQPLVPGNELDLDKLYTYFATDPATGPMQPIGTGNYPKFKCTWLNPANYEKSTDTLVNAKAFTKAWNENLTVFGTIVDPFVPITTYSSILPIQNLQLPSWTWENAMKKMTAFFHMGPVMVTSDIQKYWDPKHTLTQAYKLDPPSEDQTVKDSTVCIPNLPIADWAWLQPFIDSTDGNKQKYMALGLGKVDNRPKFEKGPYTAIEGYLQLKAPIVRPDSPKKDPA